jgi:hypothetical protein
VTNWRKILTARHHDPFRVFGAHAVVADTAPVISMCAFPSFAEQAPVIVGADCPA